MENTKGSKQVGDFCLPQNYVDSTEKLAVINNMNVTSSAAN
jgi:hypothetical protein